MDLHQLWDWLDRYDGARTEEAVDLYLYLQEFASSLSSEDPDVVTFAARHIWIAESIAFACSYENALPIIDGAWEIAREKWAETREPHRQTRISAIDPEAMNSEVYDHLCTDLPHFAEEWAVIKEALDKQG